MTSAIPDGSLAGDVLVVGIYLADRENLAPAIVAELARSTRWRVEQRWAALGRTPAPAELEAVTTFRVERPTGKFAILNRLLASAEPGRPAFVLACDDDVALPPGFLDRYLELVVRHDLALAQPARTHGSSMDHPFVEQLDGLDARRTRFVEIGPVFSVRSDAVRLLTPFPEASPMGWGLDFVWPVSVEDAGLRMGIVDATPVGHELRPLAQHYDTGRAKRAEADFLATRRHLSRHEALTVVEAYA